MKRKIDKEIQEKIAKETKKKFGKSYIYFTTLEISKMLEINKIYQKHWLTFFYDEEVFIKYFSSENRIMWDTLEKKFIFLKKAQRSGWQPKNRNYVNLTEANRFLKLSLVVRTVCKIWWIEPIFETLWYFDLLFSLWMKSDYIKAELVKYLESL